MLVRVNWMIALVIYLPAVAAKAATSFLATRRATPARQPRWTECSGCGHRRAERRLAGAGLGRTVRAARETAKPIGRHALCTAASTMVTVDHGEGRPRSWRALRGSPDVGPHPLLHLLTLPSSAAIAIWRREERSASGPGQLPP